jgi:hypothetical protein
MIEANFTEEGFRSWLANQPPDREWRFLSHATCAIASFLREHCGAYSPHVGGYDFSYGMGNGYAVTPFPGWLQRISVNMGHHSEIISAAWLQNELGILTAKQQEPITTI